MSLEIPQLDSCPFCACLAGIEQCVIVAQTENASAFLNPRQYERGAVLVVSNAHVPSILSASSELVADVARLAKTIAEALVLAFDPRGINVFQNNGRASGQTVPHYHVHVVPRYPTSDPTRLFREQDFPMLSEAELHETAERIRAGLNRSGAGIG